MLARPHVLPHKRSGFKIHLFRISSQNSIYREFLCFLRSLLLHRILWQKADSKHLNILLVSLNPTLTPVYTTTGGSRWVWHMHHWAVRLSVVALCHHGWAVEGLWRVGTCSLMLDCALRAKLSTYVFWNICLKKKKRKKKVLVTFITLNAGKVGLGFFSSISEKLLVYQKPQESVAFPCLLVILLGVFFGCISSTKKHLFVLCPVAYPWSLRCQSGPNNYLTLFLSKERWELHWWGCGGKDDIKAMQKMWLFWNSCGLRNISNPRSKWGGNTGWCRDSVCLLPAFHWKQASKQWKNNVPFGKK